MSERRKGGGGERGTKAQIHPKGPKGTRPIQANPSQFRAGRNGTLQGQVAPSRTRPAATGSETASASCNPFRPWLSTDSWPRTRNRNILAGALPTSNLLRAPGRSTKRSASALTARLVC